MRFARQFALLLLLSAAALAQQDTPKENQDAPPKGSMEGVVYRPGGLPLKHANLTVFGEAFRDVERAVTDGSGRFLIEVPPGRYRCIAEGNGYAPAMYGSRKPGGLGAIVAVGPGEHVRGIDLHLLPTPVITGRVVDEDGEPLAKVTVGAYPVRLYGGNPRGAIFSAQTDSTGHFRLDTLVPGKYHLGASAARIMLPSTQGDAPTLLYPAVYYPGAADSAQAAMLDLRPGDELQADFNLTPARAYRVSGRILNSPGDGTSGIVQLVLRAGNAGGDAIEGARFSRNHAYVDNTGTFAFTSVLPGAYTLTAGLSNGDSLLTGTLSVVVGAADVVVDVPVYPQPLLSCTIKFEGSLAPPEGSLPEPTWLNVFFESAEGSQTSDTSITPGEAARLGGVPMGAFRIWAEAGGKGSYLKAALLNGQDAIDQDAIVAGMEGTLDLVFASDAGAVEGTVRDAQGQAAPTALVILMPAGRRRNLSRLYRAEATDQHGHFVLRDVVPGEYRVFAREADIFEAFGLLLGGELPDPAFIRPYEDRAKTVRVAPGATASVDLPLSTAPN